MSLMSPRLIAPMIAVALAAVAITSCSQQLPTAPSAQGGSIAAQPAAEYWVTLFDETEPGPPKPPPPPGTTTTPWPPGPPPAAQPGVPVPKPPSTHSRVHIRILPGEPVMHSGKSFGIYSCRDHKYTWEYDQEIITDTGVPVTFGERFNFFDGRFTSKNTTRVSIPGNNSVKVHTRWCSSYPGPHYVQTRWEGADDYNEKIELSGPWVRLATP